MANWTQEDIDTLKAAIGGGVLSVSYAGPPARSITYQSLDAMRALLADMTRGVNAASPAAVTSRRAVVRSGFRSGGRSSFRRNE